MPHWMWASCLGYKVCWGNGTGCVISNRRPSVPTYYWWLAGRGACREEATRQTAGKPGRGLAFARTRISSSPVRCYEALAVGYSESQSSLAEPLRPPEVEEAPLAFLPKSLCIVATSCTAHSVSTAQP